MNTKNDDLDLIDRLVGEYADRLSRDEDPRAEELIARAPTFRPELERLFRMLHVEQGDTTSIPIGAGEQLGEFRVVRELGRGGMAVVYEAEQESLRRRVALKVLRHHLTLDFKQVERFQREARAAAKLAHPHVVPIHAVGAHDGHAFIAFELAAGPTLANVVTTLRALGRRPTAHDLARASLAADLAREPDYTAACVRLLGGVFDAVDFAHRSGILHRDLKPSNILLDASGKPLVADFGLAKDMGEVSLSVTGETLGTPHYMSPEQASALNRVVDARSDVYSLGVVLYELLTLHRPIEGDTMQDLVANIATKAPRAPWEVAPDVRSTVGDVVLKALSKEPADRYADVASFHEDLSRALAGNAVSAEPAGGSSELFNGLVRAMADGHEFEFRSRGRFLGLPWVHVIYGQRGLANPGRRCAKGWIAVGDVAVGAMAVGWLSCGVISIGVASLGALAFGLAALGHSAFGLLSAGWRALGAWTWSVETPIWNEGRLVFTDPDEAVSLATAPVDGARAAQGLEALPLLLAGAIGIGLFVRALLGRHATTPRRRRWLTFGVWVGIPLVCLVPFFADLLGFDVSFRASSIWMVAIAGISGLATGTIQRSLAASRASGTRR